MSDLHRAWKAELRKNANASAEAFAQESRVKMFFSKQGSQAHNDFLKRADSARYELQHHKQDCEKAARQFRAQGLYPWAEQWELYGKNPDGPFPECTHQQLKDGKYLFSV
jgi:hypothetical protein